MSVFVFEGAKFPFTSERTVEYPWEKQHLVSPPARVLDVGIGHSAILALRKGLETFVIDIVEEWILSNAKTEGLKGSVQDIRQTSFPDGFFDQVIFISTLEHVGMNWYYNRWLDVDGGDLMAMRETRRILKDGGSVLITVPYEPKYATYQALRVYDDDRLRKVSEGFRVTVEDFFVLEGDRWLTTSRERACQVGCPDGYVYAIICFEVRKA